MCRLLASLVVLTFTACGVAGPQRACGHHG